MVYACFNGVFSRSDELIEATRAYERKKIDRDELKKHFETDTKRVIEFQISSNLDGIHDGFLEWQDIFRPFAEGLAGIKVGGVSRWFNNNTFYRKPIVIDKLVSDEKILERWIHIDMLRSTGKRWTFLLPGPYTFARLCKNRYYKDPDDLILDFAQVLADEVKSIERYEPSYFQLCEPALVYYPPEKEDLAQIKNAVELITTASSVVTGIHTYFGDLSKIYPEILDFNVDSIGVDFYETPLELLDEHSFTKYMGCGCIDARNSSMENVGDIVAFIEKVLDKVKTDYVSVCPNCDLDFLPRSIAEKKVEVMMKVKDALNGEGVR